MSAVFEPFDQFLARLNENISEISHTAHTPIFIVDFTGKTSF